MHIRCTPVQCVLTLVVEARSPKEHCWLMRARAVDREEHAATTATQLNMVNCCLQEGKDSYVIYILSC